MNESQFTDLCLRCGLRTAEFGRYGNKQVVQKRQMVMHILYRHYELTFEKIAEVTGMTAANVQHAVKTIDNLLMYPEIKTYYEGITK